MPTCDYCGFIVPDPCYSFEQMARRQCPVLTVPQWKKQQEPSGPPWEVKAPIVDALTHYDIWNKKMHAPSDLGRIEPLTPAQLLDICAGRIVNVPKSDPINHPHHYARWPIEPIEFILRNKLPAWLANVIKYAMRYDAKDGLKDLYKARSYLDMEIRRLEGVVKFWEVPVAEERRLNAAPHV